MQPETNQPEGHFAPLKKITPLSKYLAMAIFIVMPFVGGWIGYNYMPEKIVETEKLVEVEKSVGDESELVAIDQFNIGLTIPSHWAVESVGENEPSHETHRIKNETGESVVSISHTMDLASYSMIAPVENRTSLREALEFELVSIKEVEVGGIRAYSGYSINEDIDSVLKQVWVDKDGQIYVFSYDPENENKVSEILKNLKW